MAKQLIRSFSRRDFLKMAGVVSAAGIAAACTPAPTAAPAAEPTKAPEATKVPEPTKAPPVEQVVIRYGRHDPVDGDTQNVKEFMDLNPNIKVEQEVIGDFLNKVYALSAAGSLPDVLRSWEAMVLDLGRVGQVIDLQQMVAADSAFKPDDFYANWWDYPVVGGKRVGIPDSVAPHATFYNVGLFESSGVEVPDPKNFTWDDFTNKAKAISKPDKQIWGSEAIPVGWTYFTLKQVWQNGGDFYSSDYKECIIDQKEAVEAIQYWADLQLDGNYMPTPSQLAGVGGENAAAQLLSAGHIGMQRMGVWITNDLMASKIKFNIAPEPKKVRMDTITHGAFNAIPATTKDKDSAWKWLNFHCSTKGIYNYSLVGKFPGTRKSTNAIDPHPWVVKTDFEVNWDIVPQCLDYGHVLPGVPNEGEVLKVIGDALTAVYTGTAKAKDILPQIAPKATKLLQQTS